MLPLATSWHTQYHLHPFYFVFKFKVLVAKQHPTNTYTYTHACAHTHTHTHTHTKDSQIMKDKRLVVFLFFPALIPTNVLEHTSTNHLSLSAAVFYQHVRSLIPGSHPLTRKRVGWSLSASLVVPIQPVSTRNKPMKKCYVIKMQSFTYSKFKIADPAQPIKEVLTQSPDLFPREGGLTSWSSTKYSYGISYFCVCLFGADKFLANCQYHFRYNFQTDRIGHPVTDPLLKDKMAAAKQQSNKEA